MKHASSNRKTNVHGENKKIHKELIFLWWCGMSIYIRKGHLLVLLFYFIFFCCCSILFWTLVLLVPFETIFMLKRQMNHTYTLYQKHFQLVCSAVPSSHSAKKITTTTTTMYKRIIKFLWEYLRRGKPFLYGLTCQKPW